MSRLKGGWGINTQNNKKKLQKKNKNKDVLLSFFVCLFVFNLFSPDVLFCLAFLKRAKIKQKKASEKNKQKNLRNTKQINND